MEGNTTQGFSEVLRLQDYEPGKDMGKDWYDWRIIHLVDEINRLTDLLSKTPVDRP